MCVGGGADSSRFLSFVSSHELWSSFVATFRGIASKLNAVCCGGTVQARQGCAGVYIQKLSYSSVFPGTRGEKKKRYKETSLWKKIITPIFREPRASLLKVTDLRDVSKWCRHDNKGIIQIRPPSDAKHNVWPRGEREVIILKSDISHVMFASVHRLHISLRKLAWVGAVAPLPCPLIYSAVVVKWQARITWVVINDCKTATSSC